MKKSLMPVCMLPLSALMGCFSNLGTDYVPPPSPAPAPSFVLAPAPAPPQTVWKSNPAPEEDLVGQAVESMLADESIVQVMKEMGGRRPGLAIGTLDTPGAKDGSTMRVDPRLIVDLMRTRLVQSRKFRILDLAQDDKILEIQNAQHFRGTIDPQTAVRMGKQLGARLLIYGSLSSSAAEYHRATFNLMDLESGELIWSDTKQTPKLVKQ